MIDMEGMGEEMEGDMEDMEDMGEIDQEEYNR